MYTHQCRHRVAHTYYEEKVAWGIICNAAGKTVVLKSINGHKHGSCPVPFHALEPYTIFDGALCRRTKTSVVSETKHRIMLFASERHLQKENSQSSNSRTSVCMLSGTLENTASNGHWDAVSVPMAKKCRIGGAHAKILEKMSNVMADSTTPSFSSFGNASEIISSCAH